MTKNQIKCANCNGSGRVPLSGPIKAALSALSAPGTSAQVIERMGRAGFIFNNRTSVVNYVNTLIKLKLAERSKRKGVRGFVYSLKSKPAK